MKCANCDRDAFYIYQVTKAKDILYCSKHLPNFLEARRRAGLIKTTEQMQTERDSAINIIKTEPIVEGVPAPKPKRKKKAAAEPSEE